jgi:hypothetical protein
MYKLKMIALVAALSVLPGALAQSVKGEKLDSGLGVMVYGESLDSGLGELVYGESLDADLGKLGADYTAWEFMPEGRLLGESLDSGLGSLTREDMEAYLRAPAMLRTSLDR